MGEREESFVFFVKKNDHKEHDFKVAEIQDGWRGCRTAPSFCKLNSSFLGQEE